MRPEHACAGPNCFPEAILADLSLAVRSLSVLGTSHLRHGQFSIPCLRHTCNHNGRERGRHIIIAARDVVAQPILGKCRAVNTDGLR